eukprot:TRINITY_DN8661_c0_g1_i1.p1 TRINITY_DN8661_c0_g1~~TRINITY_DN8661_c0_g1_i1.p1  ORF type:complete len:456 (+),score=69.76 TRINITY_DN8661_c0_g1_i1:182-1549(+)
MCIRDRVPIWAGSHMLVHAASGAFGLLMLQWGQLAGASVIGTASHASKREYLRMLGVHLVFSSQNRPGSFAAEIGAALPEHMQLDLAINSAACGLYDPTAALVRRGGRVVELAARGIVSRSRLAQHSVVLTVVSPRHQKDPMWQQHALLALRSRERTEHLSPLVSMLPGHQFSLQSDSIEAFKMLQCGAHIGTVLIALSPQQPCDKGATVLVTGGTGALGLMVGAHLSCRGAERLLLVSRSGSVKSIMAHSWRELIDSPGSTQVELSDVSNSRHALETVGRTPRGGRLGIVHAAGVLADALIGNQTQAGLQMVLAPKAQAAWNLHDAIGENQQVELFTLFSSASAILGIAGQANYAAANSCLDRLATIRQAKGYVATSLQWGSWAMAGMAQDSARALRKIGAGMIQSEPGLAALELSLIHISEPTRLLSISYAVFCLKKKKKYKKIRKTKKDRKK